MTALKQWIDKYLGTQVDGRLRSFRIVLCVGFISTILLQFTLFAAYNSLKFHIIGLVLSIGIAYIFYLTSIFSNLTWIYWIYLFFVDDICIAYFFIRNDGVSTYAQLWLLVGFMMIFIFLDDMPLYTLCAVSLFICGGAYAYFIPQYGVRAMLIRFGTFVFWGVGLGMVIRYQLKKLSDERRLSEMQQKEIESISEAKLRFFDNMSHDIRIPINTIVGLNEMTLRNTGSDEVYENSLNIQRASSILLTLVDDIMDLNKIESGNLKLVPVKYKPEELIAELVNMVWDRTQNKGLAFNVDVSRDCPSVLYGDVVRIKQVVTNILTNAVKYTEKGFVSLDVSGVKSSSRHYKLIFKVEDTGIGIKNEDKDKLFSTFRRVNEEQTGSIEGTGLGLSISKQLIELMKGSITVESEYQKGSIFTVEVEQEIIDAKPVSISDLSRSHSTERYEYSNAFEAPDARILAVDDNEMNLLVIKKLLNDTKMTIDTALSGSECIEKTLHNNYDLIIMDYLMPGMNGEETLKAIRGRSEGYCQNTPVIVLTGNVMANAEEIYGKKGFSAFLSKPIDSRLLEETIFDVMADELIETVFETSHLSKHTNALSKKKKLVGITSVCVVDLPDEMIEEYDIRLLRSYVITEEGRFVDTNEITTAGLMEYLDDGKKATATIVSLEEYEQFFAESLKYADNIIFFTLAAATNPEGFERAKKAAEKYDGKVTIFDSMNLSSGIGILIYNAAKMAEEGAEIQKIIEALTSLRDKVSMSFIVDSVESLYRNKWIGKGIKDTCDLLQLHPVLALKEGKMAVNGISVGKWEDIVRKHVKRRLRIRRKIDDNILFIVYTGLSEAQIKFIINETVKYMEFKETVCVEATSVISVNCGNGAFGLVYMKK